MGFYDGIWNGYEPSVDGRKLQTAPKSTSLSLGKLFPADTHLSQDPLISLLTEDSGGNISAYRGQASHSSWNMQDISTDLYASIPSGDFGPPFSIYDVTYHGTINNITDPTSMAVFMAENGTSLFYSAFNSTAWNTSMQASETRAAQVTHCYQELIHQYLGFQTP